MGRAVGVFASDTIVAGVVDDHQISGTVHHAQGLHSIPPESIAAEIVAQIQAVCESNSVDIGGVDAVGLGFPGIIRDGVILESPNLPQMKGLNLSGALSIALGRANLPVLVLNDADAVAAGIAATRGQLEKVIRAWTLGVGIGFGRYPHQDGVWEGGHITVSLDPKEQFCGCHGQGHLEGIMGHRAMRLRFLDMEPEEVFAAAEAGDKRCEDFVKLWHRALAAATATSVHMDGPGRFYISGMNAGHINVSRLSEHLLTMVKMSPLQGSVFEVVKTSHETAVIGAAVNAVMNAGKMVGSAGR